MQQLEDDIGRLDGPILVIGAGGFLGTNLFHELSAVRDDVYAGVNSLRNWRLQGADPAKVVRTNLRDQAMVDEALQRTGARTVFYAAAYGAYSFENDQRAIHDINYRALIEFLELVDGKDLTAIVHAGSSSEYGLNAAGPSEEALAQPNSHYAVSKLGAAAAISYYGTVREVPILNLRLYSVFGPYEDSARLIPALVRKAREGSFPPLTNPDVSRDFVYVRDAVHAFVRAALSMGPETAGRSFNIGTARRTTVRDLAETAREVFNIEATPEFGVYAERAWDETDWYADPSMAETQLGWRATTDLTEGLRLTADWQQGLADETAYWANTKAKLASERRRSIAAVVACYKDGQAIPIMYERLVEVFTKIDVDYQIIFVNDSSPDNSEEVIRAISRDDPKVLGISHSRNFGSQMAFRSGMELASTDAVVLLDGDLQDPPELIEEFYYKWRDGANIVYGERVQREMSKVLHVFYRRFYYVLQKMADFHIPRDAGDFSLIDRKAARMILAAPERDLFLRGLRAYVGFRQEPVPYVRPERMFGVSTNSWTKNFEWAKKAIFSYSSRPISVMTSVGICLFGLSILVLIYVVSVALIYQSTPRGIPTVVVLILFFGGLNMMGLATLGEYIGKIVTEVKRRPPLIRRALIRDGRVDADLAEADRLPSHSYE